MDYCLHGEHSLTAINHVILVIMLACVLRLRRIIRST
jgi:hypothetical protein